MMLGSHKKKQAAAEALTQQGGGPAQVLTPPEIPPLRTFVIYGQNYGPRPRHGEMLAKEDVRGHVVEAHGLGIDDSRMISFTVFFFVDGDPSKPAQATKLVLNADAWDEVEEVNAAFPVLVKH